MERLSGIVRVREVTAAVSVIVVCVEGRDAGTGAEIMPPAGAMALLLGADTIASLSDEIVATIPPGMSCALGAISSTGGAEAAAVGAYVGFSSLDGSLATSGGTVDWREEVGTVLDIAVA